MRFLFGNLSVDSERLELRRGDELVEVQPKVLQVLLYLLQNSDRIVTKRELLDGVWADSATVDSSLTRAISLARKLVGKDVIENVRGTGYRIAVSIEHAGAPVPISKNDGGPRGFVGRRLERATIDRWRESATEAGVVGLVVGEPGIGKTRLVREFTADARRAGACVVWGAAPEGAPRAFDVWRQILPALLDRSTEPTKGTALHASVEVIADVIEEVKARRPDLQRPTFAPPTSARPRFFSAVVDVLTTHAAREPLVVVIDDVQWVDTSSMGLLEEAIRETAAAPLLWLLLGRRTARLRGNPIEEALSDWSDGVRVLELAGLDSETIGSLADQLGAEDISTTQIAALHDRTGGNPLFAEQLVRAGLSALEAHETDAKIERESLRGVFGIVRRRLDALPNDCRRLLEIGSIFGRSVPISLLADVVDQDEFDVLDALEPAESAELIVTEPDASSFLFDHELIRETLMHAITAGARARYHRSIAEALERRLTHEGPSLLPTLAWHYGRCISRSTAKRAVDYTLRAARHEMESLAFEGAIGHYRDALRAETRAGVGDESDRAALVLELATALFYVGDPVEAEKAAWNAVELARRCGDHRIWARATVAMSDWVLHRSGQVPDERVASLEAVLDELPEEEHALRAQVLMALSQDLHWSSDSERVETLALRAVQEARVAGSALALCQSLSAAFHAMWDPAEPARRDAVAEEEVQLALESGDAERICLAHHHRFATRVERGEYDLALADVAAADAAGRALRRVRYLHAIHVRAANVSTWLGNFHEAEAHCDEADALRQHRSEDIGFLVGAAQRFTIARLRGQHEALTEILEMGIAAFPEAAGFEAASCMIAYEIGDHDRAGSELSDFWQGDELVMRRDMLFIISLVHIGEVTAALGTEAQARRCYSMLLPSAGRIGVLESVTTVGSTSRPLALLADRLGDTSAAEAHFRSGLEIESSLRARPWEAYSRRDFGAFLARQGRTREANEQQSRSSEIARELGMAQLASAVEQIE